MKKTKTKKGLKPLLRSIAVHIHREKCEGRRLQHIRNYYIRENIILQHFQRLDQVQGRSGLWNSLLLYPNLMGSS